MSLILIDFMGTFLLLCFGSIAPQLWSLFAFFGQSFPLPAGRLPSSVTACGKGLGG